MYKMKMITDLKNQNYIYY